MKKSLTTILIAALAIFGATSCFAKGKSVSKVTDVKVSGSNLIVTQGGKEVIKAIGTDVVEVSVVTDENTVYDIYGNPVYTKTGEGSTAEILYSYVNTYSADGLIVSQKVTREIRNRPGKSDLDGVTKYNKTYAYKNGKLVAESSDIEGVKYYVDGKVYAEK